MATIVPAILAASEEAVAQQLLHVKDFASEVQIDIVDGSFAKPASWPYSEQAVNNGTRLPELPHTDALRIELDLMIDDPELTLETWMATGATRLLFHIESTHTMRQILHRMKTEFGHDKDFMTGSLAVGIAMNQTTHLELIEPYLSEIDYVQFMGIQRIGVQGQPFSKEVFTLIERFRKKYPHMPVQVDGGVSITVAAELLSLGVSRLVVGSALWTADNPIERFKELESLTERYGIFE